MTPANTRVVLFEQAHFDRGRGPLAWHASKSVFRRSGALRGFTSENCDKTTIYSCFPIQPDGREICNGAIWMLLQLETRARGPRRPRIPTNRRYIASGRTIGGDVDAIGRGSCYEDGTRCAETLFFDYPDSTIQRSQFMKSPIPSRSSLDRNRAGFIRTIWILESLLHDHGKTRIARKAEPPENLAVPPCFRGTASHRLTGLPRMHTIEALTRARNGSGDTWHCRERWCRLFVFCDRTISQHSFTTGEPAEFAIQNAIDGWSRGHMRRVEVSAIWVEQLKPTF